MNNQKELNTIVGEDGQKLSPVLPEDVKNYLIDIDGTVTEDVPNEEPERMLTCMPFPDALLRTAGEKRISNFLLYQLSYSELIFIDTLWPDVNGDILDDVLLEFNTRNRTYGRN